MNISHVVMTNHLREIIQFFLEKMASQKYWIAKRIFFIQHDALYVCLSCICVAMHFGIMSASNDLSYNNPQLFVLQKIGMA